MLENVLTARESSRTGEKVFIKGIAGAKLLAQLHNVLLNCELLQGPVSVAAVPNLPVQGVSLLLGNDVAGNLVPASNPEVEHLNEDCPGPNPSVFTHATSKAKKEAVNSNDTVVFKKDATNMDLLPSFTRSSLISAQKADPVIAPLLENTLNLQDVDDVPVCYYINADGVLMRKWQSADHGNEVHQIVAPRVYHAEILRFAHESPSASHLGVKKTFRRLRKHFFWPTFRKDIAIYCHACHSCQGIGKPNTKVPGARVEESKKRKLANYNMVDVDVHGAEPLKQAPYRVDPAKELLAEEVRNMHDSGIIQERQACFYNNLISIIVCDVNKGSL